MSVLKTSFEKIQQDPAMAEIIESLERGFMKYNIDFYLVGAKEAIMVDLLRRSGQFEQALGMCDMGLEKNPEEVLKDIFRFQQKLISKSDVDCYKIADARE